MSSSPRVARVGECSRGWRRVGIGWIAENVRVAVAGARRDGKVHTCLGRGWPAAPRAKRWRRVTVEHLVASVHVILRKTSGVVSSFNSASVSRPTHLFFRMGQQCAAARAMAVAATAVAAE